MAQVKYIYDLTKRGGIPAKPQYQTRNNEHGRPQRDADAFHDKTVFHYALVELDNIIVDEKHRLWKADDAHIDRLADSIENDGLMTPIGVRWRDDDQRAGQYNSPVVDLIYGYHRLAAMKKLHAKTGKHDSVSCLVYSPDLTIPDIKRMESIENLLRRIPTDAEKKKFLTALSKYKASKLVAVLDAVSAPVAAGGSHDAGAAAGEKTLESVAKSNGVSEDTLRRDVKQAARALGVENYDNTDPEKRAELATAVAAKIVDIEADPETHGPEYAKQIDTVKRADRVTAGYSELVVEKAKEKGRDDLVEMIENSGDRQMATIEAADKLGISSPRTNCQVEIHWPETRIAAKLLSVFGLERLKRISRAIRDAINEAEGN